MKAHTKRKKWIFFEDHSIISYALLIIGAIIFMILEFYPPLQPLRDLTAYKIISRISLSGIIIFFAWFSKNKPVRFEQIVITVFAMLPCLSPILKSYRISLLIQIVLFLILFCCCVKCFLSDKKYSKVTAAITLILGTFVIYAVKDYTFLHNSNGIHFWQIGLFAAVIITTVFTILLIKNKFVLEDDRTSEKVVFPFIIFGASFILVSFLICNLNYALDFSEPIEFSTTISDKKYIHHAKGSSEFVFIANVQGEEKSFDVDQSEYYSKEVGDSFSVELYSGAFNHEYYIYKYIK